MQTHDCKRLEQLCRYITRPALSDERVQFNAAGQMELRLKTPWGDGTMHLVTSPLEFMQRLAAFVPRPKLAPDQFGVRITSLREVSGSPLREPRRIGPERKAQAAGGTAASARTKHKRKRPAKLPPAKREVETAQARPNRIGWAQLLKRVVDFGMQHCPNYSAGELKVIAAILERPVIEKMLSHLGLGWQPLPGGRARVAWQDSSHLSRAGRHKHLAPGRAANQRCKRQFQTLQRGIYRPPIRQSGFPHSPTGRLKSLFQTLQRGIYRPPIRQSGFPHSPTGRLKSLRASADSSAHRGPT